MLFAPARLQHIVTLKRHNELLQPFRQKDMSVKITPSYINPNASGRNYRRWKIKMNPGIKIYLTSSYFQWCKFYMPGTLSCHRRFYPVPKPCLGLILA
jgi:hypothetical protein